MADSRLPNEPIKTQKDRENETTLYFIVGGLVVLAIIFGFIYMKNSGMYSQTTPAAGEVSQTAAPTPPETNSTTTTTTTTAPPSDATPQTPSTSTEGAPSAPSQEPSTAPSTPPPAEQQ